MSFFNKLFSIKEAGFHYVIRVFGIKFKIRSLKLTNKEINEFDHKTRSDLISARKYFVWANENKLTQNEKRWLLETLFYEQVGYFPDLTNPKSFNEKLNWMKLHYDNPLQKRCVDKYEFKEYIKEKLGEGYTIPLIGVYKDVNDIDFTSLPNKFVIKTTVNGGSYSVQIVKDKSKLDINDLKYKFSKMLQNFETVYHAHLTKAYEGLKPRIIIEEFMEQLDGQLNDYKFHCFHGEPKMVLAIEDRDFNGGYKFEFVDMDWKRLNFHRGKDKKKLMKSVKPKCFDEMVRISRILSKDFPMVRVDFYEIDGKVYVGELTFTPMSGFGKYSPVEWDYKIGEWLDLSKLEDEYLIKEAL